MTSVPIRTSRQACGSGVERPLKPRTFEPSCPGCPGRMRRFNHGVKVFAMRARCQGRQVLAVAGVQALLVCVGLRAIMLNFKIVSSLEERGNEAFP